MGGFEFKTADYRSRGLSGLRYCSRVAGPPRARDGAYHQRTVCRDYEERSFSRFKNDWEDAANGSDNVREAGFESVRAHDSFQAVSRLRDV